jgi:hypothetical protein
LTAGDDDDDGLGDGLGDSLRGFSNLQDDSKIQRLRNDDMSAAGITVAAPAEAPADSNGDGSNLGDLLDLMNQPQQPVSSIKPYQLDSHHYSAQVVQLLLVFRPCLHVLSRTVGFEGLGFRV